MISFVKGPLAEAGEGRVVVDTGGVGLEIRVPLSVLDRLPAQGEEVKLYTYFQVKEDSMGLYGFLSRQDREMFQQLLSVNGVGPKGALGILSAMEPDDLRIAVFSGDAKGIAKAPGIGIKTAQRVILDLKDKISIDQFTGNGAEEITPDPALARERPAAGAGLKGAAKEAVQALTALGYSGPEAVRAVKKVELTDGMTTEDVLKASLRHLAF